MRRGVVSLAGRRVGSLVEHPDDTVSFSDDTEWLALPGAVPVSLTLPLRAEPYRTRGLHPFFENLLPEGWLLELSTARLKIPKDDAFGLLLALCADCIGGVEVHPAPGGER